MSIRDTEKKIQQERIIEASRKNLMGLEGKFGTIVINLGKPIIQQTEGGEFYSSRSLDEYVGASVEEEDQLPTISVDVDGNNLEEPNGEEWVPKHNKKNISLSSIGWHFDGLSRGMHLEIWWKPLSKEIVVTYKGYLVYHDMNSDVQAYAPWEEWESKIEQLYVVSKKIERENRIIEKEKRIESSTKKRKAWWQQLRERWGI